MNLDKNIVDCKRFLNTLVQPTNYSFTSDFYNNFINLPISKNKSVLSNNYNENKEFNKEFNKENKFNKTNEMNKKSQSNFYNINAKDQLFWCFLMIIKSWEENDLPEKNERFTFENNEKIGLTELLRKNSNIPWKEMKITKTSVYSNLSESINGEISVDVLKALSFLCEKNIIYKWGRCYISIPGGRAYENENWYVIQKDRTGHKLAIDNYAKQIYEEIKQGKYYQVKDINKPLLSISSYKSEELQEIAKKFDIIITRENGKIKLKKDIYNEIIEIIHKID